MPRPPAHRTWLRIAVLLLALLVPGAHSGAHALPLTATVCENGGTTAEYDVLGTALRPVTRSAQHPAAPPRPEPLRPAGPAPAAHRGHPAPPLAPYSLHCLRSVVLRC
ncbi:hypothetical protein ABZX40_39755 [Streptomyces sp. NPDC004610]|uniref:hypothetical protein n=1 Tax=unclassified Streptomyces TaxID=2593676 RepID=UPI0033B50ECF